MMYISAENREFSDPAKRVIVFARQEAMRVASDKVYPEHLVLGYHRELRSHFSGILGVELTDLVIADLRSRHAQAAERPAVLPLSDDTLLILEKCRARAESQHQSATPRDIMVALLASCADIAELFRKYGLSKGFESPKT